MQNEHLTPRESPLDVGTIAPDFTLLDASKTEWNLAEAVKQGDVVLCFIPFAFTGVCSMEMQCVTDDLSQWKDKGVTVVGISCDSHAALDAWAAKMHYEQTLLSDLHRSVCKAYGLYWPEMNVAHRGTVVIGQNDSGVGKIKWIQKRAPGTPMNVDEVMQQVA